MTERPFPPGSYPVVVIGSGPGGLQVAHELRRLGVEHAVLSADEAPGGMFLRFPLFQRLITWTKPYAPAEVGSRAYEWYDWNSLLGDEPDERALVHGFMDGSSYFPQRSEMEQGLTAFAERTGLSVRYGCRWEATARDGDDGFVLATTDGEYRARILIVAVGMTQPWTPPIPGLDQVPHYVATDKPDAYSDKRVFVVGKRNSGFEIATALLPYAKQILLGSPRPARISVVMRSTAAARARYLQPYEDHVLSGGNVVLDCSIERVERTSDGYRVHAAGTTRPGRLTLDVDDVIAATGFSTPLGDLPDLGVTTFYQGRLPAQSPYWESTGVPGIYFAGSVTQGAVGLRKYGIPSNSAAVHGFRYNARLLARHIAQTHFGVAADRHALAPDAVVPFLLAEATDAPELWNQQSYLARVVSFDPDAGICDDGIVPLAHFIDHAGPDAAALAIETDADGDTHPAVYVRRGTSLTEHLLASDPLRSYTTGEHRAQLTAALTGLLD